MPPERNVNPKTRKEHIAMAECVFPEEIMLCILTRLPVKSILRFKSVCKPWCKLFSSQEFVKMHKGQFSCDPKNHSFLIHSRTGGYGAPKSLWNIGSDEKKPSILECPHRETHFMKILGCCSGLICMGRPILGPGNIILWNPAMKFFKFVRVSQNEDYMDPQGVSLGFGYDAEGDDFKVVRIFRLKKEKGKDRSIWVEMYSVNADSWITIRPNFQFDVLLAENLDIVNGNPYWVADVDENHSSKNGFGEILVWFDVRETVFKAVRLYSHNLNFVEVSDTMVDWDGSVGVLMCNRNNGRVESVDVWVFDDGDRIWRKNHTFGPTEVNSLDRIWQCSKNGKMLCSKNDELFVLDPYTGWVKFYDSPLPSIWIRPYLYAESLT